MTTTRFLPFVLVLGSLTPLHAQYKAIFSFGAYGNPSCPETENIAQSPGGNLVSTNFSSCSDNVSENPPAAYEIGYQGANFTMLQEFTAPFAWPLGGLTLGTDQRYHGTINAAGSRDHGAVYRLSPSGAIVYEHDFEGGADGGYPATAPTQGADGAFYGTTNGASSDYAGTVYKIDTSEHYSVLHLFTTADGRGPTVQLVQGADMNFYGTTASGGANGLGTFYRISPTGDFSVLHDFTSAEGGSAGSLMLASDGNFYGVNLGNNNTDNGGVLKITPSGTVSVFYTFAGGQGGSEPSGGLVEATDGNFYGTLNQEGAGGGGTIYRLTPAGVFTKLHDFWVASGIYPEGTPLQHTSGKLYGFAYAGGDNNKGVIWEYDPGLAPFVTFLNVYGEAGAKVDILGQYFDSSSVVLFNGVPALNPVIQSTYIEATVPVGATTGYITVTTSKGILTSNKPFVVH